MKKKILELKATGQYTNSEIARLVGCSIANVGYHLTDSIRQRVNRQNQKNKRERIEVLKREAGGRCKICKYDKCLKALDFHHLDPTNKTDAVAVILRNYSIARAREEARKCVLLCCRCHRELHEGLISI